MMTPVAGAKASPPELDMQCPRCRHESSDSAKYCSQCGTALEASFCACCGRSIPASAEFCLACGDPSLRAAQPEEAAPPEEADPEAIAFLEYVRQRRARRRRGARGIAGLVIGLVAAVSILLLIARPERPAFWRAQVARTAVETTAADRAPAMASDADTPPQAAPRTTEETVPALTARTPEPTVPAATARTPEPTVPAATARTPEPTVPAATARTTEEAAQAPTVSEPPTVPEPRPAPPPRPALPPREGGVGTQPGRGVPPAAHTVRSSRPAEAPSELPLIVGRDATVVIGDLSITVHRDARLVNSRRVVDYTVRLADRAGRPVGDAAVQLRGQSRDGSVMEAQIEASTTSGAYEASLFLPGAGFAQLALRIVRADRVLELPMTVTGAGAAVQ
jgi:hypothetical protein